MSKNFPVVLNQGDFRVKCGPAVVLEELDLKVDSVGGHPSLAGGDGLVGEAQVIRLPLVHTVLGGGNHLQVVPAHVPRLGGEDLECHLHVPVKKGDKNSTVHAKIAWTCKNLARNVWIWQNLTGFVWNVRYLQDSCRQCLICSTSARFLQETYG